MIASRFYCFLDVLVSTEKNQYHKLPRHLVQGKSLLWDKDRARRAQPSNKRRRPEGRCRTSLEGGRLVRQEGRFAARHHGIGTLSVLKARSEIDLTVKTIASLLSLVRSMM